MRREEEGNNVFSDPEESDRSPESESASLTFICHLLHHFILSSAHRACECPAVTAGAPGALVSPAPTVHTVPPQC